MFLSIRLPVCALLIFSAPLAIYGGDEDAAQLDDKRIQMLLQDALDAAAQLTFNPTIVRAVRLQNAEQLSMDVIKARDEAWKGSKELSVFMRSLQTSKAGRLIARIVNLDSKITEIFVADRRGANVAAFPATSDYWQGDEDKFKHCFDHAKPVVLDPQIDIPTNTFSAQLSMPVLEDRHVIGVLVVGISLSDAQRGG